VEEIPVVNETPVVEETVDEVHAAEETEEDPKQD
jgi:hypothetical protein